MAYELNHDIRYCITNQRAAFLNLATDRYFCLPTALDQAFQSLMRNSVWTDLPEASQAALLNTGIFSQITATGRPEEPKVPLPTRDCCNLVLKGPPHPQHLAALLSYRRSKRDIRTRSLKDICAQIAIARDAGTRAHTRNLELAMMKSVARFRQIRAVVKVHDQCLIWSLAMLRYLATQRTFPHLVVGVRLEPFSAHAWLQLDDLILSCPVEEALLYTPILVA